VAVLGAIIIGNLGETYQDVLATIKYAKELDIDIAQFTALTPLPKTGLYAEANAKGWIEDYDWTHYDFTRVVMRTPDLTRMQITELVRKAYSSFYIEPYWGAYFFSKFKRYTVNRRNHWFFKMLLGFMRNIKPIGQLIKDISSPAKVERREDAMARPSKLAMNVPDAHDLKKAIPIME
jgi:radical SAM superfamily enzyme YgiQ (UPF0313 family)